MSEKTHQKRTSEPHYIRLLSGGSFDGRKSVVLRSQCKSQRATRDSCTVPIGPIRCLELKLEGELDGAGAADLVEGVETAIGAAGAQEGR